MSCYVYFSILFVNATLLHSLQHPLCLNHHSKKLRFCWIYLAEAILI